MLSQQSLMELFIPGLDEAEDICGSRYTGEVKRFW